MTNRVGQRLGNYRLIRLLGRGGFAEVYLGEHVFLRTQAAIKVLQLRLTEADVEGFVMEARTIASLTHPNIVRVLEFGVEDNTPFLVMEYALNGSLRQRHPKGTLVPFSTIVPYVKQITSALQYAHNRRLIHRDIKPENLLLGSNNEVLLSDFGTALVVETLHYQSVQELAGTVTYMAPEQIQGKPRPASDQYGLGIVVYEWLCGRCPFQGSLTELYSLHVFAPPPSLHEYIPTISPEVEEVIMTALAKDPERRFANVSAFATAFEEASKPILRSLSGSSNINLSTLSPEEDAPTLRSTATVPSHPSRSNPPVSEPMRTPTITPSSYHSFVPVKSAAPQPVIMPTPVSPPPQTQPKHRLSRRALVLGLGLAGVAAAAGAGVWVLHLIPSAATSPHPTPVPSKPPLGTTFITYTVHTGQVYTIAWTPKGQHIASGGADHKVHVWDPTPPAGHDLNTYIEHAGSVNAVAWSPDGQHIASAGSDNTVRVWDALSGNTAFFYHHTDNIRAVAWSADGTLLASGSDDKTVQVHDATTGSRLLTYGHHTGLIWAVGWSPDGQRIASASDDKTIQVWDASTGTSLVTYRNHTGPVKALAWSPDGHIASGSSDKTVQVWDSATGSRLVTYSGHSNDVYAVAWSSNGQHIASGSWQEVRIWDPTAPSGKTLNTYSQHMGAVHAVAWSPDGQRIASGADDFTVKVWQAL